MSRKVIRIGGIYSVVKLILLYSIKGRVGVGGGEHSALRNFRLCTMYLSISLLVLFVCLLIPASAFRAYS